MTKQSARYAAALFDLAMESGVLNESLEQAVIIRDTLKGAECQSFIAHPHISSADKCAFFSRTFAGFHEYLLGFLHLAVAKNCERYLSSALEAFINMINLHGKKTTASVISATMLNEAQIGALKEILSKKLEKKVEISLKVDPSVIGGININVDGYFIDRTVKKRLHDIKVGVREGMANDS